MVRYTGARQVLTFFLTKLFSLRNSFRPEMSRQYTLFSRSRLHPAWLSVHKVLLLLFFHYKIHVKWFQGAPCQTLQKEFLLPQWPGNVNLEGFRHWSPPNLPWSRGAIQQKSIILQSLTGEQGFHWAISVARCILPSIIFHQIGIYHLKLGFQDICLAAFVNKEWAEY